LATLYQNSLDEENSKVIDFSTYEKLTAKSSLKLQLAPPPTKLRGDEKPIKRRRNPGSLPLTPTIQKHIDIRSLY